MVSKRTTIMLPEDLQLKVKSSGVSNFSSYIKNLILSDLNLLKENVAVRGSRVDVLRKRLKLVEKDWKAYVKGRVAAGDKSFYDGGGVRVS